MKQLLYTTQIERYKLTARILKALGHTFKPDTFAEWQAETDEDLATYDEYLEVLMVSLQANLLARVRGYWRYFDLAHLSPYPIDYEKHQEAYGGTRQEYQEYLENTLSHFKRLQKTNRIRRDENTNHN